MSPTFQSEFSLLFAAFFNPPTKPAPAHWPDIGALAGLLAGAATPVCIKEI
ncbi:MAG: hypothetical protein RSD57_17345 [Comamonas sp.]